MKTGTKTHSNKLDQMHVFVLFIPFRLHILKHGFLFEQIKDEKKMRKIDPCNLFKIECCDYVHILIYFKVFSRGFIVILSLKLKC